MISRFARLCAAGIALSIALAAGAQPAAPNASPGPAGTAGQGEDLVQLKLPDADIDTVLETLTLYTGRAILRPAQLPTATYNLKFPKPIPKSEAVTYILTVLALNGIGVTPLGDNAYKVVQLQQARGEAPEMIEGSALSQPPSGKVAMKVFQLEFLRVAEVTPLLQGMLNPFYGGPVQLQNANAVMITDSVSNLQRVEQLLEELDRPTMSGMKPQFYQLKNGAKASDLVQKIRTILSGTLQLQLGQATTISADDRTNQIIVVTDPRQHGFFDELIEKMDIRADPNTRNDVIPLNHAKAADIVNVLSRIISGQTSALQRQNPQSVRPGQGPQPQPTPVAPGQTPANLPPGAQAAIDNIINSGTSEFSSIMTVVNDDRSNAIVVSGTVDDIRLLKELVAKLDIVLAQVRIEVVIAEVVLEDNDQSGISALGIQLEGDKLVGFSGSAAGISIEEGIVTRPDGTTLVSGAWDLAAVIALTTTPRKNNVTTLSVPAITTSHGKQSIIFSGETRPIVTGTVSSPTGAGAGLATSSQVTQQQIGTNMTVTPYIGVDGSVQLDIKQTVENVTGEVTVDGNTQYVIGKRETTSYVTAKTGEIIVLGGYQKKIDTKSTNRLGPIPIIGDLLGSRRKNYYRQELIFFLRPTVLTNNPAIDNAPALKQVEKLPTRDEIKQHLDPTFVPPEKTGLDRILSR